MKTIILFRHFESTKNIENKFSSEENQEALTLNSPENIRVHSNVLRRFTSKNNIKTVYCSDSKRAIDSAKLVCGSDISIQTFKEFNSIVYNSKGVSENDAEKANPDFMKGLYLYRKGLNSSYSIPTPTGSEKLSDFETRVLTCFSRIIKEDNLDFFIFFLHRSPITSILINFARKFYKYPKDFFGYIELDLGKFSLLHIEQNNGKIQVINESIEELENCT